MKPPTVRLQSPLALYMRKKKQRTVFGCLLDSLRPPVDQSVNRPRTGTHRERGDLHRMMNEARPVSQCSAGRRWKLYCDPWIWKWDSKAEFDRLSSGSWRGHTHHDELDAPYRNMCRDIMLLVPHQHFSAMPQDVSVLCGSALFFRTNFQSILIILWPGIQFVPAILCGGLWAELI